jgi:hypothetical protein
MATSTKTPGKTIYDLALHETLAVKNRYNEELDVTRVPGGWIERWGKTAGVFVLYSAEFKFAAHERKRRDARDELEEMEQGHGV